MRRLSWVDVLPIQIDRVEVGLVGISVTVQIVRAGTCDMDVTQPPAMNYSLKRHSSACAI